MRRYIDADWIVQELEWWRDKLAETHGENDEYVLCLGEVLMKLDNTPTADVRENVRGEWIIKDDIVPINFMDGYVETERCVCSNCGYEPTYAGRTIFPTTRTLLFCPNCGADMRGGNDD